MNYDMNEFLLMLPLIDDIMRAIEEKSKQSARPGEAYWSRGDGIEFMRDGAMLSISKPICSCCMPETSYEYYSYEEIFEILNE